MFSINSLKIFLTNNGGIPSPITVLTKFSEAQVGNDQFGGNENKIIISYKVKTRASE